MFGAGMAPLPKRLALALGTRDGSAVRSFVAFRDNPYTSAGMAELGRLERAMPRLLASAGLPRTDVSTRFSCARC